MAIQILLAVTRRGLCIRQTLRHDRHPSAEDAYRVVDGKAGWLPLLSR